jgi:hypothetical protein
MVVVLDFGDGLSIGVKQSKIMGGNGCELA